MFKSCNEKGPEQSTVARCFSNTPPMLGNGKDTFLFYLSEGRTGIYGRLEDVKGKAFRIRWFDPLTGEYIDDGRHDFGDSTWLGLKRPEQLTGSTAIAVLTEMQ